MIASTISGATKAHRSTLLTYRSLRPVRWAMEVGPVASPAKIHPYHSWALARAFSRDGSTRLRVNFDSGATIRRISSPHRLRFADIWRWIRFSAAGHEPLLRSEERRVGKECRS